MVPGDGVSTSRQLGKTRPTHLPASRARATVEALETRVILIRSGSTDWHEQGKLVGQADPGLSERGRKHAEKAAAALLGVRVSELLCSPLQRSVQTAQVVGERCGLHTARDQRLSAMACGHWQGQTFEALSEEPLYQQFKLRPTDVRPPGGEGVEAARRRAVAAVDQALGDAASGDVLALVTHSDIIRMLLGHYLGAPVNAYTRMQVNPGSLSIIAFGHGGAARVVASNWNARLTELVS